MAAEKNASEDERREVAKLLFAANKLVIMTGAGCSVDSGVPDFRSRSGWWRQIDPMTVASMHALETNYEHFHAFYKYRIEMLQTVRPHSGHHMLARWERDGKLVGIATQNVDGLHQQAGNRAVQELHGNIYTFRCHRCQGPAEREAFLRGERCRCGGELRPNVVLFDEELSPGPYNLSVDQIASADVVVVIGSSLQVDPANRLPLYSHGTRILLNKDPIAGEEMFDYVLYGTAEELLMELGMYMASMTRVR